ncbi:MAG: secondary thiamine-phosphate synthase enzyme YjbQ [Acidobacteria bacterium]|nr:secondary thiamine-phosphate synthase enzyme YjbQ [Acidobacteriota bacterium]
MLEPTGRAAAPEKSRNQHHALQIETHSRVELKDITDQITRLIEKSGIESGQCHIFVPHTTAAILINENYDPGLRNDIMNFFKKLAPVSPDYEHNDGNCDAHLKAALIGVSKTLLIEHGRLVLGRWQGIYFCEFDGPRRRNLRVKIVAD